MPTQTGRATTSLILLMALPLLQTCAARPPKSQLGGLVVRTVSGQLRGETEAGVSVFRGIRYAQAPVRNLRFRQARPIASWEGVRDALDFAPACPQVVEIDPTENNNSFMDEDCLALNVWTPRPDSSKRPVMVFIHGGAFIDGSARNTWYDGVTLAAHGDVVVVTLQYRLGAWGFLELAEIGGKQYEESGNLGILDQLLALHWIHNNIAAFGGDPANVTVFGESMGAASLSILMSLPASREFIHKGILESSSAQRVGKSVSKATELSRAYMKLAGANSVEELQKLSMVQMRQAQAKLFDNWFGDSSFGPTWGDTVLPEPSLQRWLAGQMLQIPLLIGTNLEEVRYWTEIEDLPIATKGARLLAKQVSAIVGDRASSVVETYRRSFPDEGDTVVHLATDVLFRMPAIRMAEAASRYQPTYMYLFSYRSTSLVRNYGAMHSMELPFVFGVMQPQDVIAVTGRSPGREKLMEQIQGAWVRFARAGDPNYPGLPRWPVYEEKHRATMELGLDCRIVNDPYSAQRRAWEGVAFDGISPSVAQVSAILSDNH